MATIIITLPEGTTLSQGQSLSFTAPCNSEGVTSLNINSINYPLLKTDNSFLKEGDFITGALILVVIDPINHKAYLQMSDKINTSAIVNDLTTGGTAVPLSAEQGKVLSTSISILSTRTMKAVDQSDGKSYSIQLTIDTDGFPVAAFTAIE